MHRRTIAIAAGAVVALLSLLMLAAACGDGDNGDTAPTATSEAAVNPTATESANVEPTGTAEPEPTATEVSAPAESSVDITETEFVLSPSVQSVPAGTVTFNITNEGAIFHNLRVIATDLAPDALPTDDVTFGVDETQVDVRASGADLDPGQSEQVTVDLEPGNYVLICNVPTHYDIGMHVAFTVE